MIHLTHETAQDIHDALEAAEDYIETARLNEDQDDEVDLRRLEIKVGVARRVLGGLMGERKER